MFGYYLELAWRQLRRSPGLTVLMVLGIAFGVAASMTTWAVYRGVSGDPIPARSARLFVPQIDIFGPSQGRGNGEPQSALDYADAMALMRSHRAHRQSAIYAVAPLVQPIGTDRYPIYAGGYAVSNEFFPMLDVPFKYGSGWDGLAGAQRARVVVIGAALNRRLFGGDDSVGRIVTLDHQPWRVLGVLDDWNPQPVYFDVPDTGGFTRSAPDLFVPFRSAIAAGMENAGVVNGVRKPAEPGFVGLQHSSSVWISFLVQLDNVTQVARYRHFLDDYAREQQRVGRFDWPPNNRLRDLMSFLDHQHVVPRNTRVALLVSIGLLFVCLLNTIGLLLAKFMRRSGEVGVRRALGAPRSAILAQFLVEASVIGAAGGALGLALTALGMLGVDRVLPLRMAGLARFDSRLFATTLAVSVVATLLVALYPSVRAAGVQPAWQLKSD